MPAPAIAPSTLVFPVKNKGAANATLARRLIRITGNNILLLWRYGHTFHWERFYTMFVFMAKSSCTQLEIPICLSLQTLEQKRCGFIQYLLKWLVDLQRRFIPMIKHMEPVGLWSHYRGGPCDAVWRMTGGCPLPALCDGGSRAGRHHISPHRRHTCASWLPYGMRCLVRPYLWLKFGQVFKQFQFLSYLGVFHRECWICWWGGPTFPTVCCYRWMARWRCRQTLAQELIQLRWAHVTS